MIRRQLKSPGRDITDSRVLRAMSDVPRHEFIPIALRPEAYEDHPIPIGFGQTISQPFIVALMTQALELQPTDRVLEIGTGCGYQAAILGRIVQEVHTVEIVPELAEQARATLHRLGFRNVEVHFSDGFHGWPDAAPYDAIVVACAPTRIPQPLVDQLRDGGRMIIPVGNLDTGQDLVLVRKRGRTLESDSILAVRFVPMTGD